MAKPLSKPPADALREDFLQTGDPLVVLARGAKHAEDRVVEAWQELLSPAFPAGLALLAVGGFGRRELYPHSDVDLLLLVENEPSSQGLKGALSAFLRMLWDAGLRLSHSVRTPGECCEVHDGNIELNISLLDERFLAGDRALYAKLEARLPRFLSAQREILARHLCRLTRTRHAKFGDTIYHLEPNVKETPGGLRDFQFVRWLSQLRNARPGGRPPADPLDSLRAAWLCLSQARCYLHFQARRDQNLLGFDAQEEISQLPFVPERDAAAWMRSYYRHARDVYFAATRRLEESESAGSSLLASFRNWRSRLSNAEFTVARDRVYLRNPHLLDQNPEMVLRLFEFVARHGIQPAFDSGQRISDLSPVLEKYFSAPRPLWPLLETILSLPHAALAVESMSACGFLKVLFPEWRGIDCLVVRDFYHRYTVDEHTLVSIQELTRLPKCPDPLRGRFAGLLSEVERPGVLLLALLFHDTGKAMGEAVHVQESARLAASAMDRIRVPEGLQDTVRFLIERHLDLSGIMNSRDLDEPATARYIAERTGTLERLKYLTLITYADISAVNPAAMTPWRLEQLWRLYLVAHAELTSELDTSRIAPSPVDSPETKAFLEGLPTRYLRTHTPSEIEAHLRLRETALERGAAADIRKLNGVYSLTLMAGDRPFLLASIAGALAGFGMNILKAEAFANRQGLILDTFVFADPSRTLELNPTETDRLRLTIERVALGKLDVKHLLQNRPKPAPPSRGSRIQASVSFNQDASPSATLIEIVAEDRPGLLYDLTRALSSAGCNIEVVLIDTEAHKAIDVFYVTAGRMKLSAHLQQSLRQGLLQALHA